MSTEPVPDRCTEHYPSCPCGACQHVRQVDHDRHWASLSLHERIQESLNAKIEGDGGRMPERGMFVCADIQALLNESRRS